MIKNSEFFTSKNDKIRFTVYNEESFGKIPLVIFIHGFKGFKDWGFFPYAADYFAENKFCSVTLNFSHNGIGEEPEVFSEADKFTLNTFSLEVNELDEFIEAYLSGKLCDIPEDKRIFLIGHSRGALPVTVNAIKYSEVSTFALWNGISKIDRFSVKQKQQWKENGFMEVLNVRTNQIFNLGYGLLDEIENHKFDFKKILKDCNKKFLIVQASNDLAVKPEEATDLLNWSNGYGELFVVEKTGHTFDVVHPMEKPNSKLETVLNKTKIFFEDLLIN